MGKKLDVKFEFAEVLWRAPSEEQGEAARLLQSYDWVSWLEAVERDISALERSVQFKRVDELPDHCADFTQAFLQKQVGTGPWDDQADSIKAELERAAQLAEQIREAQTQLSDTKGRLATAERELRDAALIKENLERKFAEQQQRALRVPMLEDDNKRLNEAVAKYQATLSEYKQLVEQLNEEKTSLEKKSHENLPPAAASKNLLAQSLQRTGTIGGHRNVRSVFNQRVLMGDRGLSAGFKEVFKKMSAELSHSRHLQSVQVLRQLAENRTSAFNRYVAAHRPQNEELLGFLARKQDDFSDVVRRLREKQARVQVFDLSAQGLPSVHALRTL